MTSIVRETAHDPSDAEVVLGVTTRLGEALTEQVVLQDGEMAERYIYDNRIVVVSERKKFPPSLS